MGFFKNAWDLRDRVNRSPVVIALMLLLLGGFTYSIHWRDDPSRDGAEKLVRADAAIAQAAGDIRRVNLKRVAHGACGPQCSAYTFSVVGTRAIVRVTVEARAGAQGKPDLRIPR